MELRQQKKRVVIPPPLPNPTLVRETVTKVDQCIARLQELQHTVRSSMTNKAASSVSLRMIKDYSSSQCSPPAKLPTVSGDDAVSWSMSVVLLRETVGDIARASRFARNVVEAVAKTNKVRPAHYGPKTPIVERIKQRQSIEASSSLQARRKRDKRVVPQTIRSEKDASNLRRAKSNINLKMSTLQISDCGKENKCNYTANRVSPRARPWATKAVLFPNPLFESLPDEQTPCKFLMKSPWPAAEASRLHVNIESPTRLSNFQTRARRTRKKSTPLPILCTNADKLRRSLSPARLARRLAAPFRKESYYRKMRCDGVQKWC